jgi:hypothetical protein
MGQQQVFRIGGRWFEAVGPQQLRGDAWEFVARILPFGLHHVDVQGLSSADASYKLYQHLERRGQVIDALSVAIVERGRAPSDEYTAELKVFLRESQDDPASLRMQRTILAVFLQSLTIERDGGNFLQVMRNRDPAT